MNIDNVEYVDITTAAKILNLSTGRVRQLVAANRIAHTKIGERLTMLRLDAVQSFSKLPRPNGRPQKDKNKN